MIIPSERLKFRGMGKRNAAYLYILPAILFALLFSYIPLIRSVGGSFLHISMNGDITGFAGFGNYARLLSDPAFQRSILHTVLYIVLFVPLNTVLTLSAAALTRKGSKAEFIFFSPAAVSLSAYALIFKEIFRGRVSVINRILGTDIAWLESPGTAMLALVILGVFLDFGLDYILLLSAFRSLDKDVIDSAQLDGAEGLTLLSRIEIPMIKPMLYTVIFMAVKDAALISAPIMILTEGGPFRSTETVMYFYYLEAFRSGNRAVESTIATLMVAISILAMALVARRRKNAI